MRNASEDLDQVRSLIDILDEGIVELIAQRLELAREAAQVKVRHGLQRTDPAREAAVVRRAAEAAKDRGLDSEAVRQVFWNLIGLSRRSQETWSSRREPALD